MASSVKIDVVVRCLGCAEIAARQLAARGLVVRVGRTFCELEESVRRAVAHFRDLAATQTGAASLADIRAQRIRLIKAAAERGRTLRRPRARRACPGGRGRGRWSGVLRTVRAGTLAVPSRAAQRLAHFSAHDVSVIGFEGRDVQRSRRDHE